MSIDAAYTSWSASYDTDRNVTRDLDRKITSELFSAKRFGMTVEAGCGTGKNSEFLAGISTCVLALDFSPGMLERARQNVQADNVHFVQANLGVAWPCAAQVADFVSCNLVLEHMQDLSHFFREAQRVLAPDGLLFVSELHPHRQYLGSQARYRNSQGGETPIQAYTHHVSEFVSGAIHAQLRLERLDEWWHPEDDATAPRLVSFVFRKPGPHAATNQRLGTGNHA